MDFKRVKPNIESNAGSISPEKGLQENFSVLLRKLWEEEKENLEQDKPREIVKGTFVPGFENLTFFIEALARLIKTPGFPADVKSELSALLEKVNPRGEKKEYINVVRNIQHALSKVVDKETNEFIMANYVNIFGEPWKW